MSKQTKLISYLTISFVILTIIITFYYVKNDINNKENEAESKIVENKGLMVQFDEGNDIKLNNIEPGSNVTTAFSVKNNTNKIKRYKIRWKKINNEITNKDSFVNILRSSNGANLDETPVLRNAENYPIVSDIEIKPKEEHTYTFTIKYKKEDYNQGSDLNKSFFGSLEVVDNKEKDGTIESRYVSTYNLEYDLNGGTLLSENPYVYTNKSLSFTLNNPIKEGYIFTGWKSKDIEKPQLNLEIKTGTKGDKKFTATYKPIKYSINYKSNSGMGEMVKSKMQYDKPSTLLKNEFFKEGYDFIGWSTLPNTNQPTYRENETVTNLTNINNDEITLYAVWKVKTRNVYLNVLNGIINEYPIKEAQYLTDVSFSVTPNINMNKIEIKCDNATAEFNNNKVIVHSIRKNTICYADFR